MSATSHEPLDAACVVCGHPYRDLIEVEILCDGRPNDDVARRYEIGDGGPGAELIRSHRSRGHMRPREYYRDARLILLREQGDAAAATDEGRAALERARNVFAP